MPRKNRCSKRKDKEKEEIDIVKLLGFDDNVK